jgi:hypothetical protein
MIELKNIFENGGKPGEEKRWSIHTITVQILRDCSGL